MNKLEEVIIGLLLGDGYIHKPRNINQPTLATHLATTNSHVDYILWIEKLFNENGVTTNKRLNSELGGFKGSKPCSTIETRTYSMFRDYWNKWYEYKDQYGRYGKKLPDNFEQITITPTILLHWYLGDGYSVHCKDKFQRFQIATDRFTKEENLMLIRMLERDLGIRVSYDSYRNRLRIPKTQCNGFKEYLGEFPNEIKDCLYYKLRINNN